MTLGTVAFQVMLRFGSTGAVAQAVRVTVNVATQLLPTVGALVNATVMPACGLVTVNANPVIEVVPAGI